ncbi:MAG: hypothetical protein HAW60_01050 [Bdellovibrionales bacterium]|nr:hypothetical protein [Bdellovibrionales bacterium]
MRKLSVLKLKNFLKLFSFLIFIISASCSKSNNKNKQINDSINLSSFSSKSEITCKDVSKRYQFILSDKSPYIGRATEYKDFFSAEVLDKAIVKAIFKAFDTDKVFFTQSEIKNLSLNRHDNIIESLLINDCTWYDSFFKLYSKKVKSMRQWFDKKVLSGDLNSALNNFFKKTNDSNIKDLEKKLNKKFEDITFDEAIANSLLSKQDLKNIKNSNQFEVFKAIRFQYNNTKDFFTKYPYKEYTKDVILKNAILSTKKYALSYIDDKYHSYLSVIVQSLDAHSNYTKLTKDSKKNSIDRNGHAGLGILLRCFKNSCIVIESLKKGPSSGILKNGDLILAANSAEKKDMSSNEFISNYLKGDSDSIVNLKVKRLVDNKEKIISLSVKRGLVQSDRFDYKLLDNKVAYIKLKSFYESSNGFNSSSTDFIFALSDLDKKADSLIIDLQDNGGGSVAQVVNILTSLLATSELATVDMIEERWTCGEEENYTENYTENDTENDTSNILIERLYTGEEVYKIKGEKPLYRMPVITYFTAYPEDQTTFSFYCNRKPYFLHKPIIVLINKNSASASEILSLGLQEAGIALVAGSKNSFGKGSGQSIFNSDSLRITSFLWGSFLGKSIQFTGVQSDILVDFSNKDKILLKGDKAEKELHRALPVLGNFKLPWKNNTYGKIVLEYYNQIKQLIKQKLSIPLSSLSIKRQLKEIKKQSTQNSKKRSDDEQKKYENNLVIKEAINILEDWKAVLQNIVTDEYKDQFQENVDKENKNLNKFDKNFNKIDKSKNKFDHYKDEDDYYKDEDNYYQD